ncbi:MAG: DNA/RNA nuclease SfsA [Ruminococcaceae bacterium]|nr:DNA/RNA nuclease SfsA [Oscillospiraceae bacterium]
MRYREVVAGRFLRRPNRFVAYTEIEGRETVAHVKNTGRCRELLVPGCTVYLAKSDNPARRTAYDLVAVEKPREGRAPLLINMDAQAPNEVAAEWLPQSGLFSPSARLRREVSFGASRFDFYVEDGDRRAFVEVKGVTLEEAGVARFPDAPTARGVKHLRELISAVEAGYEAFVLFVLQMKEIAVLRPNDETDPAFGEALRAAVAAGVRVLAVDCAVTPDTLTADAPVPVELNG